MKLRINESNINWPFTRITNVQHNTNRKKVLVAAEACWHASWLHNLLGYLGYFMWAQLLLQKIEFRDLW